MLTEVVHDLAERATDDRMQPVLRSSIHASLIDVDLHVANREDRHPVPVRQVPFADNPSLQKGDRLDPLSDPL